MNRSGGKRIATSSLLFGLMSLTHGSVSTARAQTNPQVNPLTTPNPQRDLEVLRRLEEDYLRAEIEDDTAIASSILAEDYVGLKADGSSSTKADVLNRLGRHERRREPYLITATNMREHLFGDSACVTYNKVYSRPGTHAEYTESVLHLLVRRDGIWRLQLSSPLPTPRP
jgi:hypothetical protein